MKQPTLFPELFPPTPGKGGVSKVFLVASEDIKKGERLKNHYGKATDKIIPHIKENNAESQRNLNQNRGKFTKQCQLVLDLLREGKRLTRRGAYDYGIASLERRIKDLRENGIVIKTEWVKVDGKNSHKEYFVVSSL